MLKKMVSDFFLGILIAFSISTLFITSVYTFAGEGNIPILIIWQSMLLSTLCSLINLVYRLEKLTFLWQSILGYLLTTTTIMICSINFKWYNLLGSTYGKLMGIFLSFLLYSLFYLFTWIIISQVHNAKKRKMNDKLRAYKQKQL